MDLRTGRTYSSVEEARAAGVPQSDIVEVVYPDEPRKKNARSVPTVRFPKSPFGSIRNAVKRERQEV
jgi:hypothetical protein